MNVPAEIRNKIFRSGLGSQDLKALEQCSRALHQELSQPSQSSPRQKIYTDRYGTQGDYMMAYHAQSTGEYKTVYYLSREFKKMSRIVLENMDSFRSVNEAEQQTALNYQFGKWRRMANVASHWLARAFDRLKHALMGSGTNP